MERGKQVELGIMEAISLMGWQLSCYDLYYCTVDSDFSCPRIDKWMEVFREVLRDLKCDKASSQPRPREKQINSEVGWILHPK